MMHLHCAQAVTMVRERLAKGEEPDAICRALCDHCMAPNTDVRAPLGGAAACLRGACGCLAWSAG